jgi:hypothetical protein
MRILHAPTNPADQAGILVRAMRELGHDAELWHFGPPPFGFGSDRVIDVERKEAGPLCDALFEAIERFDVFHFWYGRSLLPYGWGAIPPLWDLPILKAAGKKVFVTFVGSDVRMRSVQEKVNPWAQRLFENYAPDDGAIATTIGMFGAYTDASFVLAPELKLHAPEAELMPRAIDLSLWPSREPRTNTVPNVLHAPSHRGLKGTELIIASLERLKARGIRFELRLAEGLAQDALRQAILEADIVVDQILIGDFGITTVEAMAASTVPVVYLLDEVREMMPDVPVFEVDPDTFEARMHILLGDAELRKSIAARGRAFVETHFDSLSVARAYLDRYEHATRPSRSLAFPEWIALGGDRKLALLQTRLAEVQLARAQAAERSSVLSARLEAVRQQLRIAQRRWTPAKLVPAMLRKPFRRER